MINSNILRTQIFFPIFTCLLFSPLLAANLPGEAAVSPTGLVVPSTPPQPVAPLPYTPGAIPNLVLAPPSPPPDPQKSPMVGSAVTPGEKKDATTKIAPELPPKRSRIGLFVSGAVGGLWNYSYVTDNVANTGTLVRVSEAQLLFDAGIALYALDACQFSSNASCVDLLVRLQLGGGYEFERAMATFSGLLGVEADIYPGPGRRIAFAIKIALGYEHIFAPDLVTVQNLTISQPYRLDPNHTDAIILAASPGVLINLGDLTKGLRYALSLDLRGYFSGGQFGFLIPIEFHYRF